jgi:hypothetical protein
MIGRALSRSSHAGIELAERLDPAARKRQLQDPSRQFAQQMSRGDIGLAHRLANTLTRIAAMHMASVRISVY